MSFQEPEDPKNEIDGEDAIVLAALGRKDVLEVCYSSTLITLTTADGCN